MIFNRMNIPKINDLNAVQCTNNLEQRYFFNSRTIQKKYEIHIHCVRTISMGFFFIISIFFGGSASFVSLRNLRLHAVTIIKRTWSYNWNVKFESQFGCISWLLVIKYHSLSIFEVILLLALRRRIIKMIENDNCLVQLYDLSYPLKFTNSKIGQNLCSKLIWCW